MKNRLTLIAASLLLATSVAHAADASAQEKPVLQFRPFPYDSIPAGARASMLDGLVAASAGALGGTGAHESG